MNLSYLVLFELKSLKVVYYNIINCLYCLGEFLLLVLCLFLSASYASKILYAWSIMREAGCEYYFFDLVDSVEKCVEVIYMVRVMLLLTGQVSFYYQLEVISWYFSKRVSLKYLQRLATFKLMNIPWHFKLNLIQLWLRSIFWLLYPYILFM